MKILAIESSCDETAAAIVSDGREILSSVVASQIEEHIKYGGVVPEIASRRHCEDITAVVSETLKQGNFTLDDMDAVAVTYAPGLIGALLVGLNFAKGLAYSKKLPLIPVHHIKAHIAANYIAHKELKPPFICLVASGGHSHIIEVLDYTKFKVLGRTRDDAAGEVFDKAARCLGLPYPGGLHLDRLAQSGNPDAIKLPRPKVEGSDLDMSFSGLKTAVINLLHKSEQKGEKLDSADVAASFRKAVCEILCHRLMLAAEKYDHDNVCIAGGVAANQKLREMLTLMCKQKGYKLCIPPLNLCGDNAAMVGSQAFYEYKNGNIADLSLNAIASMPVDI